MGCSHYGSSRHLATAPPTDGQEPRWGRPEQQPSAGVGLSRRETEHEKETADAVRITGIGSVVNLVLSGAKGAAGVACGSSALIADAVHSLSDLASDAATVLAVRLSRKPADHDHPYGHGRYETVGALTVSGMVALSGVGIGLHSYEAMMAVAVAGAGDVVADAAPMSVAAAVAAASILSKELLFQQTKIVAHRTRSDSLLANAWHHRSDAMSSVVALGGVGGTIMGLPLLDPLAGLVVGGLVIRTGVEMAWESVKVLTDTQDNELVAKVTAVAAGVPSVRSVANVRARHMGHYTLVPVPDKIDVDRKKFENKSDWNSHESWKCTI